MKILFVDDSDNSANNYDNSDEDEREGDFFIIINAIIFLVLIPDDAYHQRCIEFLVVCNMYILFNS